MFSKQCARNYLPGNFLATDKTLHPTQEALDSRHTMKTSRLSMGSISKAQEVQETQWHTPAIQLEEAEFRNGVDSIPVWGNSLSIDGWIV